jgi:hypothetical protein
MARNRRGQVDKLAIDEALEEITTDQGSDFVAGPTGRNEIGNTKRAAAKVTGVMGASKKVDPDLRIEAAAAGRLKSGSKAGLRSFKEVPPQKGVSRVRRTRSNAEIADGATTTAHKGPAPRPARARTASNVALGERDSARTGSLRQRIPAPGSAVDVPKGTLVRGHPTATQSGGRSQSSTGDEKPPKRSARAGSTNRPPLIRRRGGARK